MESAYPAWDPSPPLHTNESVFHTVRTLTLSLVAVFSGVLCLVRAPVSVGLHPLLAGALDPMPPAHLQSS